MKLSSTSTSATLQELIEDQHPEALDIIERKVIKGGAFGNYGVELQYLGDDLTVETVLNTATVGGGRLLNSENPTFAFNTTNLRNISVVGAGDFNISIV